MLALLLLLSAGATAGENPFRDLAGKVVMVISPHPDDDIIGCGGALAFLSGRKNRLVVIFLTSGEKGTRDPRMTVEQVRRIRTTEAPAAYESLGFPDAEIVWFGYPDGELDFVPRRQIQHRLTRAIRARRPDLVFALDPGATYFRYHYRDHRTAALVAADSIGAAMWPLEAPEAGPAYAVPDVYYFYTAEPTLNLDITPVYDRKLAALAQHRSQFAPALQRYAPQGPPPAKADLEALIGPLTGATTVEKFRRR